MIGDRSLGLGLVVPKDDPEAFAQAIVDVLDHRSDYDGARLRASAIARFDSGAVADRLLELYATVLAEWAAHQRSGAPSFTRPRSPGGAADRGVTDPIVVVAFDPERARMLARLPEPARARITLVTSPSVADHHAGFRRVVLADVHDRVRSLTDAGTVGPRGTGWRRLARAGLHPLATARRLGILPGLDEAIIGRGGAAIGDALRSATTGMKNLPILVCADGIDYLAARKMIDSGAASAAPGGLRWLTDQLTAPLAEGAEAAPEALAAGSGPA